MRPSNAQSISITLDGHRAGSGWMARCPANDDREPSLSIRDAAVDKVLMVGEEVETCFAAVLATGNPTWAALSTSGLRALDLPAGVCEVIVLADGDETGEAAARDCARRWQLEGHRVRIAHQPQGEDFNNLLIGGARRFRVAPRPYSSGL